MKVTGEQAVELILAGHGVKFVKQYQFNSARKWAFDFCIPEYKIAIEVEGGTFGRPVICNHCHKQVFKTLKNGRRYPVREGGRHNTGAGMASDCEKYISAAVLGWFVLRYTSDMINNNPGRIIDDVLLIIEGGKK